MAPVKVRCPICGIVLEKPSLEDLLKEVEEHWRLWMPGLDKELKKRVQETNNLQQWRKELEQKGELVMFCPVCQLVETVELELKYARETEGSCQGFAG